MRRPLFVVAVLLLSLGVAPALMQQPGAGDMVARIRTEGLQRSRALALYRTLTDEIGARLTGSPAHVQAARWARDRFAEWSLANPHLEPLRVRARVAARTHLRGDDDAALRSAHRLRRRLVAFNRRRRDRTGRVRRRQDCGADSGDGGTASRRHRAHAPSADASLSTTIGRNPGSTIVPLRRATRRCRGREARRRASELMPLLARAGAAVALRPSAYRDGTVGVTGNRAHCHRCRADDCRGRRAVQRARAARRRWTASLAARRAPDALQSRTIGTATTSSRKSRGATRRCVIRSC